MGLTEKLLPTRVQARIRIQRNREGKVIFPRLVERRPRPGDLHPLPKKLLDVLLRYQQIDYLNGLKRIELRPRTSEQVGKPFGFYLRSERLIVLYSMPATWTIPAGAVGLFEVVAWFGASVTPADGNCIIEWCSLTDLAQFMYCWVFQHELGHHHDWEYRRKRSLPKTRKSMETSADLHAGRLMAKQGIGLWRDLVKLGELPAEI
jgi:hypothetical protein